MDGSYKAGPAPALRARIHATMDSLYDRQFRKIVQLDAIADGSDSVFETGGTSLLVQRSGERAAAFDITQGRPGEVSRKELPAEVREGWVWVCVDLCS